MRHYSLFILATFLVALFAMTNFIEADATTTTPTPTETLSLQQEILEFWFGDDIDQSQGKWWFKDPAVDEEVIQRFYEPLLQAAEGHYDSWMETPEGTLALIILLDQFPRHIFRDHPQAFAYDGLAQKVCLEGIRRGFDHQLSGYQRVFAIMPLMHSEEIHLQEFCVLLFDRLRSENPRFEINYIYAVRHRDIIDHFGRYPHRNAILGRVSTAEELTFLEEPGSSF